MSRAISQIRNHLNPKEQSFIDNLFSGEYPNNIEAMKAAGYESLSDRNSYRVGAVILKRFMEQTEDKREIFRAIGAHEIACARGLLQLAESAKSENTRVAAWTLICKVLGIMRENPEPNQGNTIINIFKQEITRRYQVTNIAVSPISNHTDNAQKRYELPGPATEDQEDPTDK